MSMFTSVRDLKLSFCPLTKTSLTTEYLYLKRVQCLYSLKATFSFHFQHRLTESASTSVQVNREVVSFVDHVQKRRDDV